MNAPQQGTHLDKVDTHEAWRLLLANIGTNNNKQEGQHQPNGQQDKHPFAHVLTHGFAFIVAMGTHVLNVLRFQIVQFLYKLL